MAKRRAKPKTHFTYKGVSFEFLPQTELDKQCNLFDVTVRKGKHERKANFLYEYFWHGEQRLWLDSVVASMEHL